MFSQEARCHYQNNQLLEVICQLRFPTILAVTERAPVDFQEVVRQEFPVYEKMTDAQPPRLVEVPGQPPRMERNKPTLVHQFSTADRRAYINLCESYLSLTTRSYESWERFAHDMDKVLAAFIKLYEPAYFSRVGLRYVNTFSRKALGLEDTPWKELLQPAYLGLLASEDVPETAFGRCSQEVEAAIPGGCRMHLHVGPGMVRVGKEVRDKETKLIFDLDVSMNGNVPVKLSAASLQTVHTQAGSIFRDAITDTLHEALGPEAE